MISRDEAKKYMPSTTKKSGRVRIWNI